MGVEFFFKKYDNIIAVILLAVCLVGLWFLIDHTPDYEIDFNEVRVEYGVPVIQENWERPHENKSYWIKRDCGKTKNCHFSKVLIYTSDSTHYETDLFINHEDYCTADTFVLRNDYSVGRGFYKGEKYCLRDAYEKDRSIK